MKILAIIPARIGSKGIPKKNIRLMNGKPLISYIISTALKSKHINDVFVSTDSPEIADVAKSCGSNTVMRPVELGADGITLDPVVFSAVKQIEKLKGYASDVVITLQPTSPVLRTETLDKSIEFFLSGEYDTVISVINKQHLFWQKNNGKFIACYQERLNRQYLPMQYFETGAFLITKRCCISQESRIGDKISLFEISDEEGIDIDDKNDWILAENILKRKKIIFRVDGYVHLGMGHIYNCITLAFSMPEHDVLFVIKNDALPGIAKIKEANLPYCTFQKDSEVYDIIEKFHPDIWVNDCLDTDKQYILSLKEKVRRVITIEDKGSGIEVADAVINALYDKENYYRPNVYFGYRYVCLRDEFQTEMPRPFSSKVKNVIIMFGGTDPSNLNGKLYNYLINNSKRYKRVIFNFVTGIGYDNELNGVITVPEKNIYVYPNVPRVTKYMKTADLAIIGQGRTIFEIAAMGIPAIVLAENQREMTHSFAQMENGFINLGLGVNVDMVSVGNTIDWLIESENIRKNMHDLMVKIPLREGLERVKQIIVGENND